MCCPHIAPQSHGTKFMDDSIWLIARRPFFAVNINNLCSYAAGCCRAHHPSGLVSPPTQEETILQKPLTAENSRLTMYVPDNVVTL